MSGARDIVIVKLVSTQDVIDILGGAKIYPSVAPQGVNPPYIVVHKPAQLNRQLVAGPSGYPRARVSLESVAMSAADADTIGELLLSVLGNVTNETIESSGSPPEVSGVATIMAADFDMDDYSDDRSTYRRIIDFYLDWR